MVVAAMTMMMVATTQEDAKNAAVRESARTTAQATT
jgi:hypothetical protein